MEDRIIELESRLAFQESTMQDLNDIVAKQQNLLHQLSDEVIKLKNQLQNGSASNLADESEETPPPHY